MLRWLALLLLGLNLALFLWGWTHDRPIDEPLPPLAEAPGEIRLVSEQPGPPDPSAGPRMNAPTATGQAGPGSSPGTIPVSIGESRKAPPPEEPVSAYDRGVVRPLPRASLPATMTERVEPGLLPDELDAEPPVVIPPVREEDLGVTHTWSRDPDKR